MDNTAEHTVAVPRYREDPEPPVKIPPGRTLGTVTGIQFSPDGHIWMLHIPANDKYSPLKPGETREDRMPPVCEFDAEGNFLQGWGGADWLPAEDGRQQWPLQEEMINFDDEETLWVFGADTSYDHAVQRFDRQGRLLLRIGKFGECGNDRSTDLMGCPTDAWHDIERREVFIADGYVNHRVAVFNSDTGAFLRSFGAYGMEPVAGETPEESFTNPVHAVSRGPDGFLYVCDRVNNRVQVFDAIGRAEPKFVREISVDREAPFGTVFNLEFTSDGRFMLINDGCNFHIWTVDLESWEFVDDFRVPNTEDDPIDFLVHKIKLDSDGNLFLARVRKGLSRLSRV